MCDERPAPFSLGPVALNVADLQRAREFYERAIGLNRLRSGPGVEVLGSGAGAVVELRGTPNAPPRPPRATGLFHLAVLEPGREALSGALRRLIDAGAPPEGASDHIVSEALYLQDPEGNGIEIYRDRPATEWSWAGGEVEMATLPLDLAALLAEGGDRSSAREARLGHVHLNVADLPAAAAFYTDVLGLDLTSGSYPGAAFVSAGGYHHHFGLNTWNGPGAPAPPPGALGIAGVTATMPGGHGALKGVADRAGAAGAPAEWDGQTLLVRDPDGVVLRLTTGK